MESETPGTCPSCHAPLPPDAPLGGLCPSCLVRAGLYSNTAAGAAPADKAPPFTAPSITDLQPHFPQLEILELVGRGGMGVVYKARQPKLNRYVALKILARSAEADTSFTDRFQREAQTLARLNHSNIVTVYDFGEAEGYYFLLMEFVDGPNLRQVEQARKLSPTEALAIVPPICDALQYAHKAGVVHRDIKPENILVDKEGRVKIADFGIAKILGVDPAEPLTGAEHRVGTPLYMAPEQVERPAEVDHRADIYSLGVVFYEMLTGELPLGRFDAPSRRVQIDVRLDEIVLKALEKEPARRYQTAAEVKSQVESLGSEADRPADMTPKPPDRTTSQAIALTIIGQYLLIIGVILLDMAVTAFRISASMIILVLLATPVTYMVARRSIEKWNASLPESHTYFKLSSVYGINACIAVLMAGGWAAYAVLFEERLNWNPRLEEFLVFALLWLGMLLLPWACLVMMRVERRDKRFSRTNDSPRLSRSAIAGAVFGVFGVLVFVGSVFIVAQPVVQSGNIGSINLGSLSVWGILVLLVLLLGIASPFVMTGLGWLSLNQIKQSRGRLYGTGLALFDAMLFPLIFIAGGTWWVANRLMDSYGQYAAQGPHGSLGNIAMEFREEICIMLALLVTLQFNDWIVRRALGKPDESPEGQRRADLSACFILAVVTFTAVFSLCGAVFNFVQFSQSELPQRALSGTISILLFMAMSAWGYFILRSYSLSRRALGVIAILFAAAAGITWLAKPHQRDLVYTGRIQNAWEHGPVNNAKVTISWPNGSESPVAQDFTDAQGRYKLAFPASTFVRSGSGSTTHGTDFEFNATAEGFEPATMPGSKLTQRDAVIRLDMPLEGTAVPIKAADGSLTLHSIAVLTGGDRMRFVLSAENHTTQPRKLWMGIHVNGEKARREEEPVSGVIQGRAVASNQGAVFTLKPGVNRFVEDIGPDDLYTDRPLEVAITIAQTHRNKGLRSREEIDGEILLDEKVELISANMHCVINTSNRGETTR